MNLQEFVDVVNNHTLIEAVYRVYEEHGWEKDRVSMARWCMHKKICDYIANQHYISGSRIDRFQVLEGLPRDVYKAKTKAALDEFTRGTDEFGKRHEVYKISPDIIDLEKGIFLEVTTTVGKWEGPYNKKKSEQPGKKVEVYVFCFSLEHSPTVYRDIDEETIGLINFDLVTFKEKMEKNNVWRFVGIEEERGREVFELKEGSTMSEFKNQAFLSFGGSESYNAWKAKIDFNRRGIEDEIEMSITKMNGSRQGLKRTFPKDMEGFKIPGEEQVEHKLPFLGQDAVYFDVPNMDPLSALKKVLSDINLKPRKVKKKKFSRGSRESESDSIREGSKRMGTVVESLEKIINGNALSGFKVEDLRGPRWKWVKEMEKDMKEKEWEDPVDRNACDWLESEEKFFSRGSDRECYPEMSETNSYNRIDELENISFKKLMEACSKTKGAEYCKKVEMTFNIARNLIEKRREDGVYIPILSKCNVDGVHKMSIWGFMMKGRSHSRRDTDKTDMLVVEFMKTDDLKEKNWYGNSDILDTGCFISKGEEIFELKLRVRRYPVDRMRSYFLSNIHYCFVLPVNVVSMMLYNQLSSERRNEQAEKLVKEKLTKKDITGRLFSGKQFKTDYAGFARLYFARQISYCCLNNSQLEGAQCEYRRFMLMMQVMTDFGYCYTFDIEGMKKKLQECIHSNPIALSEMFSLIRFFS